MRGLNTARQYRYLQTKGKIWMFSSETLGVMAAITLFPFVLMPRYLPAYLIVAAVAGGVLTYAENRLGQTGILFRYLRYWARADHHHPGHASPSPNYRPRVYAPWRYRGQR